MLAIGTDGYLLCLGGKYLRQRNRFDRRGLARGVVLRKGMVGGSLKLMLIFGVGWRNCWPRPRARNSLWKEAGKPVQSAFR